MSAAEHAEAVAVRREASRRRTIAIISHPDAGKSTLTEALLARAGAISTQGATHGKRAAPTTVSDWMTMEQERGISISSAAVRIEHAGAIITIIDTPGHADFSEDTYRVLSAVDAVIMLIDAAKGIERQTAQLLEVCKRRQLPMLTVVNKWDRPGRAPLDLLDEILERSGMMPTPLNWPIGPAGLSNATIDLQSDAVEQHDAPGASDDVVAQDETAAWEEVELLRSEGRTFDVDEFRASIATPTIFAAALRGVGVTQILDFIAQHAPAPQPRAQTNGTERSVDSDFTAQVFKVQSGMNPAHRDRIAYLRVCSGHFSRASIIHHAQTGRTLAAKYAHQLFGQQRETVDDAWPGDIIGLVNATNVRPGDTLYGTVAAEFEPIPSFTPEHFMVGSPVDTARAKQFRRGLEHLDEEGVIQLLSSESRGPQSPIIGAVGTMQYDVMHDRMRHEFGAEARLATTSYTIARRTDEATAQRLQGRAGFEVVRRRDGTILALARSDWEVRHLLTTVPGLTLDPA